MNPLLLTDVYNLSHQYMKQNTDWEVSQIVNRSAPMILFGLDWIAYEILHYKITIDDVIEAGECAKKIGMKFPTPLFSKLIGDDVYATPPLKIEALPDGSWVPKGTPFCQISNTVEGFGELVSWWEGVLLHAWFPSACATRALQMQQYLEKRKERLTRFHSFGFRGHRSNADGWWAGLAWNMFLPGTDDFLITQTEGLEATSIPALAHKVVMNYDDEWECYRHVLTESKHLGYKAVSIVIDTTSAKSFIEKHLVKVQTLAELLDIKPIYRPDSGDVMQQAGQIVTKLGISDKYGIIIGDSIDFDIAKVYDKKWETQGFSTDILTWGIGAGFYNDLTRDTLGWSMKTAFSNGKDRMKKTDDPYKRSIPGRVSLQYDMEGQLSACTAKPTTDYKIIGQERMPFSIIKSVANTQDTTQQELLISDELHMKIVDYK